MCVLSKNVGLYGEGGKYTFRRLGGGGAKHGTWTTTVNNPITLAMYIISLLYMIMTLC
jgi:hypothetical protein